MLKEMAEVLEGLNLQLLPEKCSALWSLKPEGTDREGIELGQAQVPIEASLVILGQDVAFRKDSAHCFQYRLRQAWKAAHANTTLLRSNSTSHGQRIRLLQALVKPCLLYGSETWKLTPDLLAKIIAAERGFTRWCLRMARPTAEPASPETSLSEWIQWKSDSAREIAIIMSKHKIERWHTTAIRLQWQWAGHEARRPGTPNHSAVTGFITPNRRGRPPPQWGHLLSLFSTRELQGRPDSWVELAQDKAGWQEFSKVFVKFVETHILRADTRTTLARDSIAVRDSQD